MQWTKAHGKGVKDEVFRHLINASATIPIVYGDICTMDVTDNRAVSGIMRETLGERALQMVANALTANLHNVLAGVCATPAGAGVTPANTDGEDGLFLCQVFGYHPAVKCSGNVTQLRLLTVTDIATVGAGTQAAAVLPTTTELTTKIGVLLRTATAPGTTPVHISIM